MSRRWRGELFLQSFGYHHHRLLLLFLIGLVLLLSVDDSFYWQSSALPGAGAIAVAVTVDAFEQDLAFTTRRTSSFVVSDSSSSLNRPYQLLSLRENDCDSPEPSSRTTASHSVRTTKQQQWRRRRRRRQPELWLDLRDMAIHPKAAIDCIEEKLMVGSDNDSDKSSSTTTSTSASSFLPDRILLSQGVFQNLIDHSDLYLTCQPEIMYQKNADRSNHNGGGVNVNVNVNASVNDDNYDDGDGDGDGDSDSRSDKSLMGRIDIFSSNAEGLSFPFGRLVPFGKDVSVAVSDPLSVMDVLAKGRWLVLGHGDGNSDTISSSASTYTRISEDEEILRMDSVGDFIAIASLSAFTAGNGLTTTSDSGLVLPTTTGTAETVVSKHFQDAYDDKITTEKSYVGGIAVPCRHKSSLMTFASIHRSTMTSTRSAVAASTSTTTTMSDSGILIQSTVSEQDDNNDNGQTNNELPTAIILPFDVDLWEMAFMLYG